MEEISTPKSALIIEDESALSSALETRLIQEGYAVTIATNGANGLKLLENNDPSVIILDLMMPVMNGLDFLKFYQERFNDRSTPIMILSNNDSADAVSAAFQQGVFNFLIKSDYSLKDVVGKVNDLVEGNG